MSSGDHPLSAEDLARSFDQSFAEPPPALDLDHEDFLAIRVGPGAHAIRAREVAGIRAGRPITPIPSHARALVGLAGLEGTIVPVFDLAALLGYEPSATPPAWLLLHRAEHLLALGVTGFEGHLRVSRADIRPARAGEAGGAQAGEVVHFAGTLRTVVALAAVVAALRPPENLASR